MNTENLPDSEIRALLRLIQDEDEGTVLVLKKQLRGLVDSQRASVQTMVANEFPQLRSTVESLIEESRWDNLEAEIRVFAERRGEPDLEQGLYLLSKFSYHRVTRTDISFPLDTIAAEIRESGAATASSGMIDKINHTLFTKYGFRGNESDYYDPDNSFLFSVLRKRMGSPIALSCIYLMVAARLDMQAGGMALPGHFVVQIKTHPDHVYLDPFRRGRRLTLGDCKAIAARQNTSWDPAFLVPSSPSYMLARTSANLANAYDKAGNERKAGFFKRCMEIFE
ncbi:MAG: transglutaminase-like domain-containing protein [bacterium]